MFTFELQNPVPCTVYLGKAKLYRLQTCFFRYRRLVNLGTCQLSSVNHVTNEPFPHTPSPPSSKQSRQNTSTADHLSGIPVTLGACSLTQPSGSPEPPPSAVTIRQVSTPRWPPRYATQCFCRETKRCGWKVETSDSWPPFTHHLCSLATRRARHCQHGTHTSMTVIAHCLLQKGC